MKKLSFLILLFSFQSSAWADEFFKEVAKGVAINVFSEVIKSAIAAPSRVQQQLPQTVAGSVDDTERVKAIISALVESTTPLKDRIGYYGAKVDYFGAGVVDHAFILKDRTYFESRWPDRTYKIISVDEISVDPNKKFAAARYTIEYLIKRPGDQKSGTSKVTVLFGSFNVQPRIYAIKEWVSQN